MAKYPDAEFKAAVKTLNEKLKAAGEETIKVVTRKKTDIYEDFTKKMLEMIEAERTAELPDEAIDFYNNHIANENGDDAGEESGGEEAPKEKKAPAKGKGKGTAKGKGKGKAKSTKKTAPKKHKGPGIVESAVDAYMNHGCLITEDIVAHIQKKFPERNITKTVSHCWGVLKHIKPNKTA